MLLPPGADAAPGARSTLLAAVGAAGAQPELLALPNTQATHSAFLKEQARFSFHLLHTPPEGAGGYQQLQGYTVLPGAAAAGRYQTLSKWSFVLGAGERVRAAAMTDAGEAVNSPVRILGDDSLLLKYLNSHTLAFAATSPGAAASEGAEKEAPQLAVYIVDTVTGKLVHHVTHKHGAGPVQLAQSENWVLYCYWNAKARRTEMGSMSVRAPPADLAMLELSVGRADADACCPHDGCSAPTTAAAASRPVPVPALGASLQLVCRSCRSWCA